jgi:hypothetical protein
MLKLVISALTKSVRINAVDTSMTHEKGWNSARKMITQPGIIRNVELLLLSLF